MAKVITTKLAFQTHLNAALHSDLDKKSHNAMVEIEEAISRALVLCSETLYITLKHSVVQQSNESQSKIIRDYISSTYSKAGWIVSWDRNTDDMNEWSIVLK